MGGGYPAVTIVNIPVSHACPTTGTILQRGVRRGNYIVDRCPPHDRNINTGNFLRHGQLVTTLDSTLLIIRTRRGDNAVSAISRTRHCNGPIFTIPNDVCSPGSTNAGNLLQSNETHTIYSTTSLLNPLNLHQRDTTTIATGRPRPLDRGRQGILSYVKPRPLNVRRLYIHDNLPATILLNALVGLRLSNQILYVPNGQCIVG